MPSRNISFNKQPPKLITHEIKEPETLGWLLGHQLIPTELYSLQSNVYYGFVYNKFLYGLYEVTGKHSEILPSSSHKSFYTLQKSYNYKRIRLHHTSDPKRLKAKLSDKKLLLNLFRDENKKEQKIFLKIIDQNDHFLVSYAGEAVPEGIRHYFVRDNYPALQELTKLINPEIDKPYMEAEIFKDFQDWGLKLAELLLKEELQKLLFWSDTVYVCHETTLPLSILMLSHPNHPHPKPFNAMSVYLPPKRFYTTRTRNYLASSSFRLDSLGVFSSKEDITMVEEIEAITNKHRLEKQSPQEYRFGKLETAEILEGLGRFDCVHLIYHGEILENQFTLIRNNQAFLTLAQMKLAPRVPKVMFLSTCSSENQAVLKWFFSANGHSIITTCGDIVSLTLPRMVQSLYWQLFTRKSTLRNAFHSTLRTLYLKKDLTLFKLKLHGRGDEYFSEKENL